MRYLPRAIRSVRLSAPIDGHGAASKYSYGGHTVQEEVRVRYWRSHRARVKKDLGGSKEKAHVIQNDTSGIWEEEERGAMFVVCRGIIAKLCSCEAEVQAFNWAMAAPILRFNRLQNISPKGVLHKSLTGLAQPLSLGNTNHD